MKKMLTLLLTICLISTLTACGNSKGKEAEVTVTDQGIEEGANPDEASAEDQVLSEMVYGKITGIVGNELEVALVEMPEVEAPPAPSEEESSADLGDTIVAATMTAASIPGDDTTTNVELTGESLTLNVPAGAAISAFGQEAALSSLKKGNLIAITVDNLEDKNVISIGVIQE